MEAEGKGHQAGGGDPGVRIAAEAGHQVLGDGVGRLEAAEVDVVQGGPGQHPEMTGEGAGRVEQVVGGDVVESPGHLGGEAVQHRGDQLVLGAEVAVDQAVVDAGPGGDPPDRRGLHADLGQLGLGGVEERLDHGVTSDRGSHEQDCSQLSTVNGVTDSDQFDPIASPTTDQGPNREPRFVHEADAAAAAATWAARAGRKRPNILVVVMDDVGWGDFGCYGGGVAVGAPTPNIDRLAREGLLLTSCYSEPSCTPSRATLLTGRVPMRHGLQRPPMYGESGGLQDEVTVAQLLSDAGYATQAVGKWHLGENVDSQPHNVGFDDFYGFLSVSDMYSEWRDPHFFPEVVYSKARTDWIQNLPFNKAFVHGTRGGELEPVEEVTLPVLSQLDDRWARYSTDFIERMAQDEPERPWFLYHCTRGAHFDNYPHEDYLGVSPAKHPYKDTIVELDDIVGRLVASLRATGQLEDTLVIVTSDNGPNMETWPDAAYTPFRCAKGSTWEGGVRVPCVVSWPGAIDAGRTSDGLFAFSDLLPTALALAGAPELVPDDRFVDGVDQTSFLLAPDGRSNRKHHYYWIGQMFSAVRVGEYKFMLSSISDDDRDVDQPGGFTGVGQKYPYGRLYNLYLDPKETHSYLIRKLAYLDAFQNGVRNHVMTFRDHPPKLVVGLNV